MLCLGPGSDYSVELSRALRTFDLPDCHAAEMELCQQFDQPDQNKKWREGVIKSSFNYLLLDPRSDTRCPSVGSPVWRDNRFYLQSCVFSYIV